MYVFAGRNNLRCILCEKLGALCENLAVKQKSRKISSAAPHITFSFYNPNFLEIAAGIPALFNKNAVVLYFT